MGKAFRSAQARASDTGTLDPESLARLLSDNPKAAKGYQELMEPGTEVLDLLGEGEFIRYYTRLPHRAARRLADEGTDPKLDKRGRRVVEVKVRSGTLQQIKLEEGVIDWYLRDELGNAVRWERAKATELTDGLHPAIRSILSDLIGSEGQALDSETEDEEGRDTTEGEG